MADRGANRALVLAGTLQRRTARVANGLYEAAERAAEVCEQRLRTNPDAADAGEWEARGKYWRAASERAWQVAQDWASGPPEETEAAPGPAADPPVAGGSATVPPQPVGSAPPPAGTAVPAARSGVDEATVRLADDIVRDLFRIGLELQATLSVAHGPVASRLEGAIEGVDLCIRQVRDLVLNLSD